MSGLAEGRAWLRVLVTLAAACGGGFVFTLLHLPAPWLSGALVGVVALLAAGVRTRLPDLLRDLGMLLAGAVTGSAITPEMLRAAARYPVSLLMLGLTSIVIVLTGRLVLERVFGWDRRTAFFATLPGALSAVIAAVASVGGDMARVVAVQAFRMFVLVAVLPSTIFLAVAVKGRPPQAVIGGGDFALVMALALAVALLFGRLGIMAPFLIGGMIGAGLLHVTDIVHGTPPAMLADLAMLLVGAFAGSRFAYVEAGLIRSLILPGLAIFLVTTVIAALGALATAWLVGIPPAEALVAFAPGGLEAMVMLGIALGLDPLYVASHHVARFVAIAASVPFLTRWIAGADGRGGA
ncbi:MAG: AbrB family transcriptional regulator [Hyphomicrobiales bacterium]|nr:AbrB family transcriptional regulator [Hyphomicrobiales bacterium]